MPAGSAQYEAHALRYASRSSTKAAEFFRYDVYRRPDEPQEMDYFFWLVRDATRTVLVDCGFDRVRGAAKNRHQDVDPIELLARMDVAPEQVDHVVVSHMHYDHVGNLGLFPNATVSMTRQEYECWSGPYGDRELMRAFVDPDELRVVQDLAKEERLHLVDGSAELFPGIVVTLLGGHTPGQAMVEVGTGSGRVVLATDAVHYYEELERDRPFKLFTDLPGMYRAYDVLRELSTRPDTTLVAGHDPRVRTMFEVARPDCIDLTRARG